MNGQASTFQNLFQPPLPPTNCRHGNHTHHTHKLHDHYHCAQQVISEMNGLAGTYGNLFQLPPYFAYIARAFGVLEGIGLTVDPDYAIGIIKLLYCLTD